MLRFKEYLNEAFNIGIIDPDDVPDIVSQDATQLKKLFNYLQGKLKVDIPLVSNHTGKELKIVRDYEFDASGKDIRDEILKWVSENTPDLRMPKGNKAFGNGTVGKAGKKRVNENTQEMMVAALCLLNKTWKSPMSLADAIDLINEAKGEFENVEGSSARPELLDQFNDNFDDLGTAISSANAIIAEVGTIDKAYWTGKTWHTDIKSFNPPIGGVQNYNSSDIVVKGSNEIFYGYSLKKKGTKESADPTLINKPITGDKSVLKGILTKEDLIKLNNMKMKFFDWVIGEHYSEYTFRQAQKMTGKADLKKKNGLIRDIPLKTMGTYLKSRKNFFFKYANTVLTNEPEEFCKRFMELLFRTKLGTDDKNPINQNLFKFFLLTGIGKKTGQEVIVETADVHDLPSAITLVTRVNESDLEMKKTIGKLHAWERDPETGKQSKAAKLFYTIFSDKVPIIDLQVRYKGSYTANPQFQAVATAKFKELFK